MARKSNKLAHGDRPLLAFLAMGSRDKLKHRGNGTMKKLVLTILALVAFPLCSKAEIVGHYDPLDIRTAWLKLYSEMDKKPTTFKQHDCFTANYCQDTTADPTMLRENGTRYVALLAIEVNDKWIRKICLVNIMGSTDRICMNDDDGNMAHQTWDSSAAAWRD
jgi:hypothetical protein